MWSRLEIFQEPKLSHDPVLLISVSTSIPQYRILYSQARELGQYLLDKVDFRMFASMYSSAMPPAIGIEKDGIAELVRVNFYHNNSGRRDVVLFAGFSSPASDEYEYASQVLDYSRKLGIKELVSVGPRWSESLASPFDPPEVQGFASDYDGVNWLQQNNVKLLKNESAFYFANVIVGLAPLYGIRGFKLSVNHGEPLPHPKSTISFMQVLSKLGIGTGVDTSDLNAQAKQLDEGLKKAGVTGIGSSDVLVEGEEELEGEEEPTFGEGATPPGGNNPYR
jgi:proteasome assembly chaperone (PAC2) family protein